MTDNNDKINDLKEKMKGLDRRLRFEKDTNKRKSLQLQLKVCELRIMIAQIH